MRVSRKSSLLAALTANFVAFGSGFVPQSIPYPSIFSSESRRCPFRLEASGNDEFSDALAHNMARTCVRTFLTQRAIQSFMFLLESCRDPHTVKWFEENFDFQSLDQYHGTGAFNTSKYGTWDAVLMDILSRPKQVIIVSAKRRGRGHGGWSKDNPYLPDRFVEFEIDIDPPSLVSRIVSVRDQLAAEFVEDLETMKSVNEKILDSYFSNQAKARDEKDDKPSDDESTTQPPGSKKNVYTRDALFMLSNTMASDSQRSSPFRGGNFDLMVLLSTQESIHRVLREYRKAGPDREVSFAWFSEFYVSRVADYFDGQQSYGRADDFLEQLLLTPPSFKTEANVVALIDPLRITEDIIRTRSLVAEEWKVIMANIGRDHTELRKALLARQMNKDIDPVPSRTELSDEVHFE